MGAFHEGSCLWTTGTFFFRKRIIKSQKLVLFCLSRSPANNHFRVPLGCRIYSWLHPWEDFTCLATMPPRGAGRRRRDTSF